MLRSLAPSVEDFLAMLFKGFPIAVVDTHKVLYDALIIHLASGCQDPSESYMLYMVAQVAQGNKAFEFLEMPVIVIVPYLVAIEPSFGTTDSAAVSIFSVGSSPDLVPLPWRDCFTHVVVPRRFRNQFCRQLQFPIHA